MEDSTAFCARTEESVGRVGPVLLEDGAEQLPLVGHGVQAACVRVGVDLLRGPVLDEVLEHALRLGVLVVVALPLARRDRTVEQPIGRLGVALGGAQQAVQRVEAVDVAAPGERDVVRLVETGDGEVRPVRMVDRHLTVPRDDVAAHGVHVLAGDLRVRLGVETGPEQLHLQLVAVDALAVGPGMVPLALLHEVRVPLVSPVGDVGANVRREAHVVEGPDRRHVRRAERLREAREELLLAGRELVVAADGVLRVEHVVDLRGQVRQALGAELLVECDGEVRVVHQVAVGVDELLHRLLVAVLGLLEQLARVLGLLLGDVLLTLAVRDRGARGHRRRDVGGAALLGGGDETVRQLGQAARRRARGVAERVDRRVVPLPEVVASALALQVDRLDRLCPVALVLGQRVVRVGVDVGECAVEPLVELVPLGLQALDRALARLEGGADVPDVLARAAHVARRGRDVPGQDRELGVDGVGGDAGGERAAQALGRGAVGQEGLLQPALDARDGGALDEQRRGDAVGQREAVCAGHGGPLGWGSARVGIGVGRPSWWGWPRSGAGAQTSRKSKPEPDAWSISSKPSVMLTVEEPHASAAAARASRPVSWVVRKSDRAVLRLARSPAIRSGDVPTPRLVTPSSGSSPAASRRSMPSTQTSSPTAAVEYGSISSVIGSPRRGRPSAWARVFATAPSVHGSVDERANSG
jgi:hypothetical protein